MKSRKDQIKRIEQALSKYDRSLAQRFQSSIDNLSDSINLSEIERLINSGNMASVANLIEQQLLAASFVAFTDEMQAAYIAGGSIASEIAQANKITFGFDVTQEGSAQYYRNYKASKIQQIGREVRATITQILNREVPKGTPPAKTARMIRDNIGLTQNQERAVRNYRSYLDDLDNQALARRLRDKRYDPTVARAIREGKPLTADQKDKMEAAYRRKYIRRRSLNIGRTESIRLLNGGQYQYWDQAAREGVVQPQKVKRKWLYTQDGQTRDAHVAIPRLNKDGVGLYESFKTPLGPLKYPGDSSGSAANVVNCRCNVFTSIEV